ncbi:unnamed protein product [Polarella glacialis]|uniref:EF-hand domain-containing protein n=1 Tax=Polarella glacialis TaxID=89957 RepID=A0A813IU86_POLGL|nr:unnamed protein product [Polarella glacialis]
MARIFVLRWRFFKDGWGFDFLVVLVDLTLGVLDLILGAVPGLTFLRFFRLGRILRVFRITKMFPELSFLIAGMASSFRAIFWGTIMVYIMITMWAMVAVYWIHPVNRRVLEKGFYDPSDRNIHAWSSVWNAVVTLSQTVVFGDSWGASAICIIEEEPTAFVFFLMVFSSVSLAAMNLILAGIVDSGAQAREEALEVRNYAKREKKIEAEIAQQERLLGLCKKLDYDDSGSLTMDELMDGFEQNKDFRDAMAELDVDRGDMDVFFSVIDKDASGEIDYAEFLTLVNHARNQASQQVLTYVKFAVTDMRKQVIEGQNLMRKELAALKKVLENPSPPTSDAGSSLSSIRRPSPPISTVKSSDSRQSNGSTGQSNGSMLSNGSMHSNGGTGRGRSISKSGPRVDRADPLLIDEIGMSSGADKATGSSSLGLQSWRCNRQTPPTNSDKGIGIVPEPIIGRTRPRAVKVPSSGTLGPLKADNFQELLRLNQEVVDGMRQLLALGKQPSADLHLSSRTGKAVSVLPRSLASPRSPSPVQPEGRSLRAQI